MIPNKTNIRPYYLIAIEAVKISIISVVILDCLKLLYAIRKDVISSVVLEITKSIALALAPKTQYLVSVSAFNSVQAIANS
jgi:hypothetical protein